VESGAWQAQELDGSSGEIEDAARSNLRSLPAYRKGRASQEWSI